MRFYLIFGCIGLLILVVKGLFLFFIPAHKLPSFFEKTLRYIPGAALTALIAPAVVYSKSTVGYTVSFPRLLAGTIALLIALKSRNFFITLIAGVIMLWLFSKIMPI